MSVGPLNLGWLLVALMLGQWPGEAQIRPVNGARVPDRTNTLTVIWRPSPSPEVIGYALYWGLSEDSCTNRIALQNVTNVTLVGFKRKLTYHIAVAACDATGEESPWSNRIQYSRAPQLLPSPSNAVTNLLQLQHVSLSITNAVIRLSFTGQGGGNYRLQTTQDLQRWDDLCATNCEQPELVVYDLPYSATTPHRFFRLLQE